MGYKQVKLFVKLNSTFPYDKINNYFIGYLNNIQQKTEEFIIGDLFNSRENELWAIFSDKTRDSHDMPSNTIPILRNSIIDEQFIKLEEQFNKVVGSSRNINISNSDLESIKQKTTDKIIDRLSLQQIFNDVNAKIFNAVMKNEDQIINNITHMVSKYLIINKKVE